MNGIHKFLTGPHKIFRISKRLCPGMAEEEFQLVLCYFSISLIYKTLCFAKQLINNVQDNSKGVKSFPVSVGFVQNFSEYFELSSFI